MQILLHLKFLDPDFYRTYCTAGEAYSALNGAAKALTAAKSAIAGWKNPVVPNKTMIPSSIINLEEGQQWLASMVKVVPFLLYTVEQAPSLVAEFMFVTLDLLEMEADDTQLQIAQVSCSKIQQSPGFCQSPRSPRSPLRSPRRQRARKQGSSAHLSPSLSSSSEAQISNLQASFNKLVHQVSLIFFSLHVEGWYETAAGMYLLANVFFMFLSPMASAAFHLVYNGCRPQAHTHFLLWLNTIKGEMCCHLI